MKKVISILVLIIMLVGSLLFLTGCESSSKAGTMDVSYTQQIGDKTYTFRAKIPENGSEKGTSNYSLVSKKDENVIYTFQSGSNAIIGSDVFSIELGSNRYVYQTSTKYKEEHGTTEPNFKAYKEYMMGSEYTGAGKNFKELKIGNRDAISYTVANKAVISVDIDDISSESAFEITIYPKDNHKISDVMENEELNQIIDSIEIK